MPAATQVVTSFLGGEISQFAQGRYDRPDYRTSMRVCLNSFPLESGAWTRRPGTKHGGYTRGGAAGRVIKFDFQQSSPVTMEFTDGYLRFRNGSVLVTGNDAQVVVAVSSANPAVVQTTAAVTWATGDTAILPGASTPLLEGRQLKLTKIDTTHFSLQDAITGANIDGATLGALASGATIARVHELATMYVGGSWANLRVIQAEKATICLQGSISPQILTVTTMPSGSLNPAFELDSVNFLDGPYFDPVTNGAQLTPSAKTGIITLTLSFPTYDATKAYPVGAFISSSGVTYVSLADQNVGNTPASSPSKWQVTNASAAINDGRGFLGTDAGRLIRLLSEPAPWASGSTYGQGAIVSYNPSGVAGATTYWSSLVTSNTGNTPGADTKNWALQPSTAGAAIWTWGRITALSNIIDRALAGSTNFGDMVGGGGVNAAFDGVFSQVASAGAKKSASGGFVPAGTFFTAISSYVGKNYSGASAQKISQAVLYPSSDIGLQYVLYDSVNPPLFTTTINLRAKSSAPASASDGTLLASYSTTSNTVSAVTLVSNDQSTSWNYAWIEIITTVVDGWPINSWQLQHCVAEVSFFNPSGSGTSSGVTFEVLGAALPYTNTVTTWRLGLYSDTTGYPTCGCYEGGRLFLAGAVGNRWDACVSNGISGNSINFAPTDQYGTVATNNAISYTFNSDGVNQILWMSPEVQGVVMGTQAGEWLVQAPTTGPLSPTNVFARRQTKIGGSFIAPVRTEHTTLFVKRYGRKLMENFADVYSGKYSAPNLADKAAHITAAGISELAYVEAVTPLVWGRDAAGALFGITYKRDSLTTTQGPTFYGWHRHALGSGRIVESICSGPSPGGELDAVTLVTNDQSTNLRHVEVMTDTPDEATALADSWFLDNAVNPTSVSISASGMTINGLWHLNGKTVQVFAGGLDLGDPGEDNPYADFVVANGSVTIGYGDSISAGPGRGLFTIDFAQALSLSQIVVGFTYNSDGQIVRMIAQADTGARNGPALGAPSRTHRAALKLVSTKGLSIGGNFNRLYPCLFKDGADSARDLPVLSTFTGTFYDQVRDDFTYEDSLSWRVSRPFPATMTACAQNLRTEDM